MSLNSSELLYLPLRVLIKRINLEVLNEILDLDNINETFRKYRNVLISPIGYLAVYLYSQKIVDDNWMKELNKKLVDIDEFVFTDGEKTRLLFEVMGEMGNIYKKSQEKS